MKARASDFLHHRSFLAEEVLTEAEKMFSLPSYGVEGWARSQHDGVQYIDMGDPYTQTIVICAGHSWHTVGFAG